MVMAAFLSGRVHEDSDSDEGGDGDEGPEEGGQGGDGGDDHGGGINGSVQDEKGNRCVGFASATPELSGVPPQNVTVL